MVSAGIPAGICAGHGSWLTCGLVQALVGHVLVLVHPLPVALEEDLHGGHGPAAQHDGVALDDVGIVRLLQEMGQRPRGGGDGLGQGLAVLIS